ncbi:MAG: tRNA (5-methylaminomethyl-2-thiouridine)(34)-methyltransferase MnmD [Myxococcales bacterium]|nr:tRNA (5-methylaminomethyl-2-thiouridine)(34)-methyltransferase MnmD [Myxococcales bacterium]
MTTTLECPPADFLFDEDSGVAQAPVVGDIYFSAGGGLDEARRVFLQGTGLPERWTNCRSFTVAELGFGTGTNILALVELWRQYAPSSAWLHVVSVENRPLDQKQAESALRRWPTTGDIAEALVRCWPPRWKGVHRRRLDIYRVTLTIIHEDVTTALTEADFRADSWFLDGFSPSRNPEMWSPQVFELVARRSAAGARVATYTAAGVVRRGLQVAGFNVQKVSGYGTKRHRLEAVFTGEASLSRSALRLAPRDGPILVVGGGVAAASVAHALVARKRPVTLIAEGGLAAGASGAPRGLLNPYLEIKDQPHVRATMAAFAYSRALFANHPSFWGNGVLRLSQTPKGQRRLRLLADRLSSMLKPISAVETAALTGIFSEMSGVSISTGGYLSPKHIVRFLAAGATIIDATVTRIQRDGDQWILIDRSGKILAAAPTAILAGGAQLADLPGPWQQNIRHSGGWLGTYRLPETISLSSGIVWGSYIIPGEVDHSGQPTIVLGATHAHDADPGDCNAAQHKLEKNLSGVAPELAQALRPPCAMWAGVRTTSPDRLPLAGPAIAADDGLVLLSGLGSRGFAHAPLLGEMLIGDLTGAPAALDLSAIKAFHPHRWNAHLDTYLGR